MVTIEIEALSVTLGRRRVVQGVDARFEPGSLTGIIGPNGAGKSTLARAMLALVDHDGSVRVGGDETAKLPRAELARRIAYLPQGQTLHWPLSVERLVALGRLPYLAPMSRLSEADITAVDRAMARTDVLPFRDRAATELSGGERARVLLARALAVGAPALIADEPLASLDPGHQIDAMEVLRSEAEAGGTVIAVLHDLGIAARYCDRLLLMDAGRIVAAGRPAEVLTPDHLRAVYGIEVRVEMDNGRPAILVIGRS